jgi:hypothetical protein
MSRVITANNYGFRNYSVASERGAKKTGYIAPKVLSMNGKKNINPQEKKEKGTRKNSSTIILAFLIIIAGSFYLYQVNDLATKGFEIRDIEKKIQDLQKDGKQMQIREVELRSMYNIEKSTQDLDLVNSSNITYLEINGPVAMK